MAGPALDARSSQLTSGPQTIIHISIGAPDGVIIWINEVSVTATAISGDVTYGGTTVPPRSGATQFKGTGETGGVSGFFLGAGIPAGTQNVVVPGAGLGDYTIDIITVTNGGVNTAVDDEDKTSSDSVTDPSLTGLVATTDVFATASLLSGQNSVGSVAEPVGWNAYEDDLGPMVTNSIYKAANPGAGSVSVQWTAAAEDAIACGMLIKSDAGGGGSSIAAIADYYRRHRTVGVAV